MKKIIFSMACCLVMISACNNVDTKISDAPSTLPSLSDTEGFPENSADLLISLPKTWNTFLIGDSIGIFIQNVSGKDFVYDYNKIQIYYLDDKGVWVEVENTTILLNDDTSVMLLASAEDSLSARGEFLDPKIDIDREVYVRIVVTGNYLLKDGQLGEEISALIDILLSPK